MKRLVYALAFAIVGAGCAVKAQGTNEQPLVTLANGNITVDPPILEFKDRGAKPIRWQLPSDAQYEFPARVGIVIDREVVSETDLNPKGDGPNQQQVIRCERVENGRAYQCQNNHSRAGFYKYTITLDQKQGGRVSKDPVIVNR